MHQKPCNAKQNRLHYIGVSFRGHSRMPVISLNFQALGTQCCTLHFFSKSTAPHASPVALSHPIFRIVALFIDPAAAFTQPRLRFGHWRIPRPIFLRAGLAPGRVRILAQLPTLPTQPLGDPLPPPRRPPLSRRRLPPRSLALACHSLAPGPFIAALRSFHREAVQSGTKCPSRLQPV